MEIIHPRGGQCKVAISSTSFVPASNRDPRLWALLLISYALGQVTNLSKPVFPSTIRRKCWIFLRLLSKISCDLGSTPANSKCSMMALLLRLLRAVIRIYWYYCLEPNHHDLGRPVFGYRSPISADDC